MNQSANGGAAILDASGGVVAVVGSAGDWNAPDVTRVPLPGGGCLVLRPGAPSLDWPRFARAFVHEARSPLNALGIYLELLGTKPTANHPAPTIPHERVLSKAQDQVRRMDELLHVFSDLWAPLGQAADLAGIARAASRFAGHEAIRLGLQFTPDICETAPVSLSPLAVSEAMVALLAGALRAPPDSTVSLDVKSTGGVAAVRVSIQMEGGMPTTDLFAAGSRAFRELGADVTATGPSFAAVIQAGVDVRTPSEDVGK